MRMIFQRARSLNADVSTNGISDSDLIDLFNEAQDECWNWLMQNAPYVLGPSTATLSYVTGQKEYALPTDSNGQPLIDRIEMVEVTDLSTWPFPLQEISFLEKDQYPDPGEPFAYYINNNTLGFVPTPSRTASSNVKITYVPALTAIVYDAGGAYLTTYPSVPGELHGALVYDLAVLMRERDQLPVQTYAAMSQRAKTRYLLNAKRGRGQGVRYVRWIP